MQEYVDLHYISKMKDKSMEQHLLGGKSNFAQAKITNIKYRHNTKSYATSAYSDIMNCHNTKFRHLMSLEFAQPNISLFDKIMQDRLADINQ